MAHLTVVASCLAQTVDPRYEVATWRGFREAAVSHTFDDNTPNQLSAAVPLFDSLGFKLTLYTVTDWDPDWPGLAAAAVEGHEIASHTVTHPYLNTLPDSLQDEELGGSRAAILAHVPDAGELTLAYPYCVSGDDAITSRYYIAARGCSGRIEPPTPSDWLDVSSIIVGPEGPVQTGEELIALADSGAADGGWVVLLIHGIDNDGGWSPISSNALRTYLQYLSRNDSRFWVETFGNVVRYIRERDAVSLREVTASNDSIVVQVTDTLQDAIYDYPVTVRRALPEGWGNASVVQDDEPVRSELVEVQAKRYVVFDVAPDAGDVVLRKDGDHRDLVR